MTLPDSPCGTLSEVSRTSRAFSPKIARSSRSSGVSSVSPLGVTLPTRMSPGTTSAPIRMMPRSSRSASISSLTFGMSRVISSGPSLVPWEGHNYEDAIILSQRLVQQDVLTSIHIEEHEVDARDTKLGPEEITRDIPNVSEEMLADLDERGIIRI